VTNSKPDDSENRVVPLRPGIRIQRDAPPQSDEPVEDLAKYQRTDEVDDYRHRMIVNAVGFVAVVLLALAGIWLADQLAEMRKNQDCVLSGRRNCAPLEAPLPTR
jgi:hypothetical protein